MFGLELLAKLFKILRSQDSPSQIAWGFVLGMIIGLTPLFSLHNLVIFIIIVIFKVNAGMAILSFGVFSGIAFLADPFFHTFGYFYWSILAVCAGCIQPCIIFHWSRSVNITIRSLRVGVSGKTFSSSSMDGLISVAACCATLKLT